MADDVRGSAPVRGTVHETGGGVYRIRLQDGAEVEAALRGRLKLERRTGDKLVIGDHVLLVRAGETWVVDAVDDRASEMVRRGPGGRRAKVVAANLDRVLVVVAAAEPEPTPALVDRLLAVVEASGLHPILVVNKVDLPGGRETAQELNALYAGIGYTVLTVSAATREGLDALNDVLCSGTSALVGPSGVGKSSLLNALDAGLDLRTGGLSARTRRGRHTTVSSRLIAIGCGGLVADTPGFGDVGLWGIGVDEVEGCFPEVAGAASGCRFRGCAHTAEPGCAVREGVDGGRIPQSRYESYLRLREEARAAEPRGR